MTDIELTADERQELTTLLCSLIQHPSENPPGNEKAVALFIADVLRGEGIDVEVQEAVEERPNVIARLKGQRPGKRLILNGHSDVVPCGAGWSVEPFAAVIDGDRIIGRGAADMKSGVAAMMYAAILIQRRQYAFNGEIVLLFNVDEERINLGMEHFLAQGVEADYAVIGEPTSLEICVAHKGVVLVITGVLSEKQAYKAIDSQTIFIFGGTLALAKALEMTGAGKLVADQVIGMLGNNSSPFMLLVVVFALSVVMTNFMSNTATVALLVPVSLSIAAGMGADPRAVLMATVIGSSCAYATPIGMPANMKVLSAGGYKFVDYAKSGIPLIIVSTIVSLILLPILFPFHP